MGEVWLVGAKKILPIIDAKLYNDTKLTPTIPHRERIGLVIMNVCGIFPARGCAAAQQSPLHALIGLIVVLTPPPPDSRPGAVGEGKKDTAI